MEEVLMFVQERRLFQEHIQHSPSWHARVDAALACASACCQICLLIALSEPLNAGCSFFGPALLVSCTPNPSPMHLTLMHSTHALDSPTTPAFNPGSNHAAGLLCVAVCLAGGCPAVCVHRGRPPLLRHTAQPHAHAALWMGHRHACARVSCHLPVCGRGPGRQRGCKLSLSCSSSPIDGCVCSRTAHLLTPPHSLPLCLCLSSCLSLCLSVRACVCAFVCCVDFQSIGDNVCWLDGTATLAAGFVPATIAITVCLGIMIAMWFLDGTQYDPARNITSVKPHIWPSFILTLLTSATWVCAPSCILPCVCVCVC